MHCPRTHAPSILTPIHLRQKDPGPLVRSVCSLQWRLAEDIHQFRNSHANRKFHESRSNRIKSMSRKILEYLMKPFLKCYSAAFCFHSPFAIPSVRKPTKTRFQLDPPRSMCLKVIRPCFLVPMNPHQVVFFEVNQI